MIIPMKEGRILYSYLFFFLIFAVLLSLFFLLLRQTPQFTMSNHIFSPSPRSVVLATAIIFLTLLAFWILYAKVIEGAFGGPEKDVLAADFLTFLPILFFSLAPLTQRHYIGAADLAERLKLLGLGILGAVLYLKAVQVRLWKERKPGAGRKWAGRFEALAPAGKSLLLFCAALALFAAGSLLLTSTGITFAGDEPHYLLISHSLLRDGDLDLANNYSNRDYGRYMMFEGKIAPHVVAGADPESRYSFHSPGIAFLILPFYALGSLFEGKTLVFIIRLGMGLWGALFSLQVYLFARSEWRNSATALHLWALTSFTAPVFFYAVHIYPEILVAALVFAAYRIFRFSPSLSWIKALLSGFLVSVPIWFHALKYVFISFPLFLYGFVAIRKKASRRRYLWLYLLAAAAVVLVYLQFQKAVYGTYSLSAVSWAQDMTDTGAEFLRFAKTLLFRIPLRERWQTLAGYFLDQRDGLLFYAPLYFFAFLGAWEMLRRKKRDFFLLLLLTAPYVLVSALLTQRAGYAPQARPLVAVIWAAVIWLGYFLAENRKTIFTQAFYFAAGLSYLLTVLLLKFPSNLYQETTRGIRERAGGLFYLLSNIRFRLPDFLPSYVKKAEGTWLPNYLWPVAVVLFVAGYAAAKKRRLSIGRAGHIILAAAACIIFFFWFVLYPRLVPRNPVRAGLPSGERVTFYSLSRAARMGEAGRFLLSEDDRSFRFFFTTASPVREMKFSLGSTAGEYAWRLRVFDEVFSEGLTIREVRTLRLPAPPRYRLGKSSFYELALDLGPGAGAATRLNPYLFWIQFEF
jgi:hypothetical protein